MKNLFSRRRFLKWSGLSLGGAAAGFFLRRNFGFSENTVQASSGKMPKRVLGKTGFKVSLFGLGGQALIEQAGNREEATEIIDRAIDFGVNYIDTAPSYGNGISEEYIGLVMARRREEVFLASKTHDRSFDGTMRLIESSLNRLQTDYLDLYQIHNVRTEDDLESMFAPEGAVKALERLKREGVIKYLGITGHRSPAVLLKGIQNYDFDCVLMALNAADIHYEPFQKELLQKAVDKDLGIIAMKVPAHGRIFRSEGLSTMEQALGYVYSFPVSTAIVGISRLEQLKENVQITRDFEPYNREELKEIEELTEPYYRDASWFKFYW